MNRYMMRNRPMYGNMYRTGKKYRGVMEPMSRMTMDFQGRYMDSQGRMVDPRHNDYYGRWNDYDRYYGRSMFNYGPHMDGHQHGGWMDFPERWMDMSNYQMDMQGRWMDMQGRHCQPFNQWGYNRHGNYPSSYYGRNMFYPERWMDMSNWQMDTQGRWMDMQGRYGSPFNQWGYNRHGYYPGSSYGRNMYHPERWMDMSNYQMDMQGRWMDMHGRHVNPFSHSMHGRNWSYPYYNYYSSRHMDYPERNMDMSNWQMDMQGRWMDMQGRHMDPSWSNMHDNHNYWF
uniref:Reflectin 1 n=1 Tax=Sepia officinalis TaxID=6610 RepID=I0JGV0_SEPOF|nr:reflectin 1 [Sepia officinalis]